MEKCENKLTVFGEERDLNIFKKSVASEQVLDFERILPMPRDLERTYSQSIEEDKEFLYGLKKKYGHDDWYSWRIEKWGTKWNVLPGTSSLKIEHKDQIKLIYEFDTAWDPPVGVIKEASKIFPLLLFKLRYERWMSFFEGIIIFYNSEEILEITREYDSGRRRT